MTRKNKQYFHSRCSWNVCVDTIIPGIYRYGSWNVYNLKRNFPLSIGLSVGRSLCRSVSHNFLKGRIVTLPCINRSPVSNRICNRTCVLFTSTIELLYLRWEEYTRAASQPSRWRGRGRCVDRRTAARERGGSRPQRRRPLVRNQRP